MSLSVIIITKNEAHNIGECLDSVAFADECIVVDSGSTDNTREIAQSKGARVVLTDDWPGFGPQKNRALDLATQDWVLSIDADERVTPELAAEIQTIIRNDGVIDNGSRANGFRIARLSNFCGRWMRHSGWWPDYVVRLIRRGAGRFTDSLVHESLRLDGPVSTLKAHFLHYPYQDMEGLLTKVNAYSSAGARMMYEKGRTTGIPGIIGHSVWTFIRIYIMRRGFLDGREGFIVAAVGAAGSFFRYSKLFFMTRQDKDG
ncbi:MAG TPA: glycosyltransferase family 2 protein [Burkholderiaceae bacterium]|nr:glycosyltransferase family 2 protein [Burkholderiaceae bacterium]